MNLSLSRSQLVLRALVLLGPVVALACSGFAGSRPSWLVVGLVLVLAACSAGMPDSPFVAATLLTVLLWWMVGLRDGLHPAVLVAGGALVLTHVAAVLASYGPGEMPVDAPVVRLWVRRGALLLLTVPAVWGAAILLRGEPEQPGIWVLGAAAAFAATVVAAVLLTPGRAEGGPEVTQR